MKLCRKFVMALCLALAVCLVVPAVLPVNLIGAGTAQAASKKIKLNKTSASIYSGQTLKLKVKNAKQKAAWSSSDPDVAKVSSKGVVTAQKVGQAKITAKVGQNKFTCMVTVKPALSVDATDVTVKQGQSKTIKLTWQLTGKVSLTYDDASVIRCSLGKFKKKKATLTVKALRPGVSTITIKNAKTKDVIKVKVTVPGGSTPTAPIVDKTAVSLKTGGEAKVKVTWSFTETPQVDFNPDVVKVSWGKWNGTGWPMTIKGLKSGETEVTLTRGKNGEKVATIAVTVK